MIYFIADPHLGHANIIEYTGRPFKDVQEMDETIITRWNDVVGKDDIVYLLGDFCLGNKGLARRYFLRLNGGTILVVTSQTHHDKAWLKGETVFPTKTGGAVFVRLNSIEVLMPRIILGDAKKYPEKIVMCHFPIAVWEDKHYGSWHLHGHVHTSWTPSQDGVGFSKNMSVENIDYRPMSIDQLLAEMEGRGWSKGWHQF